MPDTSIVSFVIRGWRRVTTPDAQNNIANQRSLVLWKPHGIGLFLYSGCDPVQNDRPDYRGGANSDSLNEHRDWYKRMYTKDKRFKWCDTWKN